MAQADGATRDQGEKQDIPRCPEATDRIEIESGLDRQRIGQQRHQAAQVGRGVEEVRIARGAVSGEREPALQQRRACRHDEKRRADRREQQPGLPQQRRHGRRRRPGRIDVHRERDQDERHGNDVHRRRAERPIAAGQDGRIGIGGQQQRLEKEHAGVPHRRRAAEQRQNQLGDERLQQERQRGGDEGRQDIQREHGADPRCVSDDEDSSSSFFTCARRPAPGRLARLRPSR